MDLKSSTLVFNHYGHLLLLDIFIVTKKRYDSHHKFGNHIFLDFFSGLFNAGHLLLLNQKMIND